MTRDEAWFWGLLVVLLVPPALIFFWTFSFGGTTTALSLPLACIVWRALNERWPRFGHAVRRELGMTTNNINQGR